ncbi:UDP-glucuronosyltransferase 2A1-like [Elysia marginata]|uniref:UDP-glucuronosyltransferase 2A1-like n=1 Tax=Elysia marginata TaxID=1093978 RepID=A0AAV4HQ18_9GAST|nr:UDP-glucuronosyltransferase 2A1-like [Elysia marginata]
MRGSSGPLLQLSLEGKIEEDRGQGRPRRIWMDDGKERSGSTSYGDTKRKAEEQRSMERHGCQPSDPRRHLIIITLNK